MSLTLNDEQEKALREWWLQAHKFRHGATKESACLHDAIAPLMRAWRVSDGPWIIVDGQGNEVVCAKGTVQYGINLAQRICDLLNESEGR